MITENRLINLKNYLTNYLRHRIGEGIAIQNIEENRLSLVTSYGEKRKVILGIKVIKSYSFKELYEMQREFFRRIFSLVSCELDSNGMHIKYKNEVGIQPFLFDNLEENRDNDNGNEAYNREDFYSLKETQTYKEIYNYIYSIINMSLKSDFELEDFFPNQYVYIVHYDDRDYLLELTSELL